MSLFSLLFGTKFRALMEIFILFISKLSLMHPFTMMPAQLFLAPNAAKLSPTSAQFSEPFQSTTITHPEPSS